MKLSIMVFLFCPIVMAQYEPQIGVVNPNPQGVVMEPQSGARFGVGLGYTLSNEVEIKSVTESGTPSYYDTGSAKLKYKNGLLLTLTLINSRKNSFGFAGNLNYYFARDASEISYSMNKSGSSNLDLSSNSSKLESYVIDFLGIYRWDQPYVVYGINYSFHKFIPPSSTTFNSDIQGGLGFNLGVGVFLTDRENVMVEVQYRMEKFKLDSVAPDFQSTFDEAYIKNLNFNLKYLF